MKLDGYHLRRAVGETVDILESEKDLLNEINVFPVADGDTGTNLYVTLRGTWDAIRGLADRRASVVAERIAEASLMSAKGNSGVILSQFFWGFREGVDGKAELGPADLAVALATGARYAYSAVSNPVEGTILTVMRETAEWATRFVKRINDVRELIVGVFKKGVESLQRTPELLARLGKPRVVDSGAYGFTLFLEGFVRALGGEVNRFRPQTDVRVEKDVGTGPLFCSNFLVEADDLKALRNIAERFGDSVVVVGVPGRYKVHVHTDRPDAVENALSELGKISWKKVERIW